MKKENAQPNFIKMEEDVLKFWDENKSFEKLKAHNKDSVKHFKFLDGPITANYPMGVHHGWNRSLKDILLRYKGMNGYSAHYQNGFDAHGLPVELGVEKDLGLADKRDIYKLGMDVFVEKCLERVKKYSGIITEQSKRLGQWMDWDDSYYTNSKENITAIWYFLKKCAENGWITEKYRPLPWCAHCGTSLSEHELADSYKDLEHTAVFFKAPIKNSNMSILVWTTTPWTLSSNVAVAVNPTLDYLVCHVKSTDRLLVVGKKASKVLKDDFVSVEKEIKGSELVGLEYETCFPNLEAQDFVHNIVAWDQVDAVEGAGAVHIAPGCGAEDFELGQTLGLKTICPIDENGIFEKGFGFFSGKSAMTIADEVFEHLKENDKLYYTHKYTHRYPTCARCKNPLVFRLTKEWYIKADEIRPKLIEAVEDVEWKPEFLKKRMLDWLANMGDWSISRKRFYGIPLPFYRCPDCGELTVVGSLEELEKLSSKEEVEALPHIHRPYIDNIKITCPKCGAKVSRVSEVGDCWLDAGITPFSTKKYFTDKTFFENNFPADCVIEMKEQVRLWFYSLLFMSVTLVGKAPYKKVVGFASLVNENGEKFSKSGKNCITFFDAADKIGSDVIRYMFASNNMINDTRFSYGITDDLRRKIMGLWNAYVFFNTYASIDNPDIANYSPDFNSMNITDKWLIEKTNELIGIARPSYENVEFYNITKAFEDYLDDLSNWYIRVNRKRFWKSDDKIDQMNAYWTLYFAIKTTCQVMAPIIPFLTEYIWQNMVRQVENNSKESIFLNGFPDKMADVKFAGLINKTKIAREVIASAQKLRNERQIKIKQPLKTMFVLASGEDDEAIKTFTDIISEELNIKEIVYTSDNERFNTPYLSVNFKTAGRVLKGDVQRLKESLANASADEMQNYVQQFKAGKVCVKSFDSLDSDVFVYAEKPKDDYVISHDNGITVVLDITIDENLMIEGMLREFVRDLQVLRKEAGFKIEDRIFASFQTQSETLLKVISKFNDKIKTDVLITEIKTEIANPAIEKEIDVSGETITVKMCL